jgi:hypothetical protein
LKRERFRSYCANSPWLDIPFDDFRCGVPALALWFRPRASVTWGKMSFLSASGGNWLTRLSRVKSRVDEPGVDEILILITHGWIVYLDVIRGAIQRIVSREEDKEHTKPLDSIMACFHDSDKLQADIVLDHCNDRRLAVLDSGYIALVPIYTEVSDLEYVLPSASVPFAFRKQSDYFVLVGECCVRGIMPGEPLDDPGMASLNPLEDLVLEQRLSRTNVVE